MEEFNIGASLETLEARLWPHPEPGLMLTPLSALFNEPEEAVAWLVDDLLPSGGFSILVAKPKVGKSTLARALALHVSKGDVFLGREVQRGTVIYLALEEKRAEIRKHFHSMGASGREDVHIYVGGAPADSIRQIRAVTERLRPALIIIDPLFRWTKVKDGNDYSQMTAALDPLLRLARDTGAHVLCVHHSPKGERAAEDSILGSQAIFGSVDTLLIMKRHEHYRTLQTIQRYGRDLDEAILTFDAEKRLISLGGSRQDEDMNETGKAIIEFLSTQTDPVIEKVIEGEVEGRTAIKRSALRNLVQSGRILRTGKGGKNDPFRYSCFVVPVVCREQQNKNEKSPANPHGYKDYSCSQDFAKNEVIEDANVNIATSVEPINLDEMEVML